MGVFRHFITLFGVPSLGFTLLREKVAKVDGKRSENAYLLRHKACEKRYELFNRYSRPSLETQKAVNAELPNYFSDKKRTLEYAEHGSLPVFGVGILGYYSQEFELTICKHRQFKEKPKFWEPRYNCRNYDDYPNGVPDYIEYHERHLTWEEIFKKCKLWDKTLRENGFKEPMIWIHDLMDDHCYMVKDMSEIPDKGCYSFVPILEYLHFRYQGDRKIITKEEYNTFPFPKLEKK